MLILEFRTSCDQPVAALGLQASSGVGGGRGGALEWKAECLRQQPPLLPCLGPTLPSGCPYIGHLFLLEQRGWESGCWQGAFSLTNVKTLPVDFPKDVILFSAAMACVPSAGHS